MFSYRTKKFFTTKERGFECGLFCRHHYFISEGIFAVLRKDPPDFQLNYERITEYSDASADNEELLELIKLQARGDLPFSIKSKNTLFLKLVAIAWLFESKLFVRFCLRVLSQ